jgi:hypothetical protein
MPPSAINLAKALLILSSFLSGLLSAGCTISPKEPPSAAASNVVFATTSDFQSGSYSAISLDGFGAANGLGTIHSDAIARYNPHNEKVYVLNRLGVDNIQILDPKDNYRTVNEISLPRGSNPQDIAFAGAQRAYVSLYGEDYLLKIQPSTGNTLKRIDLAYLADGDGLPETQKLFFYDQGPGLLFVSLQRLDRGNLFHTTDKSTVVVIDTLQDKIVREFTLNFTNPYSRFHYDGGQDRLYLSCVGEFGNYFALDGGIEVFELDSDADNITLLTPLVTESELGYEIVEFYPDPPQNLWVLAVDASLKTSLRRIDWTGHASHTINTPEEVNGEFYQTMIAQGNLLFLALKSTKRPGIQVYNWSGQNFVHKTPINTDLPPFSLTFVP